MPLITEGTPSGSDESNPEKVSYQEMVDFKLDLRRAVATLPSAILLDPEYGAGQAIAAGLLSGHTGLLVSAETTGYSGSHTARITELLPGWSVTKAKRMGASAIKILVYFRPDQKELASRQLELVASLAGRALWQEGVKIESRGERMKFFQSTSAPRL